MQAPGFSLLRLLRSQKPYTLQIRLPCHLMMLAPTMLFPPLPQDDGGMSESQRNGIITVAAGHSRAIRCLTLASPSSFCVSLASSASDSCTLTPTPAPAKQAYSRATTAKTPNASSPVQNSLSDGAASFQCGETSATLASFHLPSGCTTCPNYPFNCNHAVSAVTLLLHTWNCTLQRTKSGATTPASDTWSSVNATMCFDLSVTLWKA